MKVKFNIENFLKRQPAGRLITLGFAGVILIGALILCLPISVREGVHVSFIDALFTSTSAVCVTGLIAIDVADHFTPFGQGVVALLIQIGGLGVSSVGVGLMLAAGKRVGIKTRLLVKESLNVDSYKGIVRLMKAVLFMTLLFEAAGAVLSYPVFVSDHDPVHAAGISIFHSIAAFNNSGFDILGGMRNLTIYQDSVLLNLTTAVLIILGGLGFLVILDICKKKCIRRLSFHSKVVISTSIVLIIAGALLLKVTEDISWMGAFFQSISARTAGFSTYNIGDFTNAGLFVLCILMFIGASPGSTGGGIKTSTFFVLVQAARSACVKKNAHAFRRAISRQNIAKASMITILSVMVVCTAVFLLSVLEPDCTFIQIFFEAISAFGTAGLSTGITPHLCTAAKAVLICVMFIGRLGAFTLLTIWISHPEPKIRYSEENIAIG